MEKRHMLSENRLMRSFEKTFDFAIVDPEEYDTQYKIRGTDIYRWCVQQTDRFNVEKARSFLKGITWGIVACTIINVIVFLVVK